MTPDEAKEYLLAVSSELPYGLSHICQEIINKPYFSIYPASTKKHHTFSGGLIVHTAEVLQFALHAAQQSWLKINNDVLITATIFHDYGKLYDYGINNTSAASSYFYFVNTSHKDRVRHVSRSYHEFMKLSGEHNIDAKIQEEIAHCIISHHGRNEWGSAVEPITVEAHLLHYADMMSSRFSSSADFNSEFERDK